MMEIKKRNGKAYRPGGACSSEISGRRHNKLLSLGTLHRENTEGAMMNAWWMLHWAACEQLLSEQEEPPPCPIGVISGTRAITPPAEKPVTKAPSSVTKPRGGRPCLGDRPMTPAERMRRYRAR